MQGKKTRKGPEQPQVRNEHCLTGLRSKQALEIWILMRLFYGLTTSIEATKRVQKIACFDSIFSHQK